MDKLNQWLTLAANIGVIAGIIFLGLELQQNNKLLTSETQYNLMQSRQSISWMLVQDPGLANTVMKEQAGESLTPIELFEFSQMIQGGLVSINYEYKQFENGILAKDDLPLDAWKRDFSSPFFQDVWERNKMDLSPSFVEFAEQELLPK